MVFLLRSKKKLRPKTRKCKQCKKKVPVDSVCQKGLLAFCCVEHLIEYSKSEAGRKTIKRSIRQDTKEQLDRIKSRAVWLREAQAAFNAWIRYRDRNDACISCGSFPTQKHGGTWDAGHYMDVGDAAAGSVLRFNTYNVHKQCVKCNRWSNSGVKRGYRNNLINKVGKPKVLELENTRGMKDYNIEKLKRIKSIFQKRLRIRKKANKNL